MPTRRTARTTPTCGSTGQTTRSPGGRLPAAVRPPPGQFPARGGLPLLQLRLRPARPDARESERDGLPRLVRQDVFAPGRDGRTRTSSAWPGQRTWPRAPIPSATKAGTITGWKRNIYSYPPIGTPDGGAHVTAADLDRFMRAVQDGRLLSAELHRRLLHPAGPAPRAGQVGGAVRPGPVVPRRATTGRSCSREGGRERRSERSRPPLPGARPDRGHAVRTCEDGVWEQIRVAHEMVVAGAFR